MNLFLSIASSLLLWLPLSAVAAPYTLVCKGGSSNMYGNYKTSVSPSLIFLLEVNFKKATQAASVAQPRPGECAWVDRALSPAEPTKFHFLSRTEYISDFFVAPNGILAGNAQGQSFKYLIKGIQTQALFYLQAENNNQGSFFIHRTGP